jgi:hypothetical protein
VQCWLSLRNFKPNMLQVLDFCRVSSQYLQCSEQAVIAVIEGTEGLPPIAHQVLGSREIQMLQGIAAAVGIPRG